jgi:hypothetical protein
MAYKDKKKQKAKLTEMVNRMKRAPCTDCGHCYDPVCMDWDHLPVFSKRMDVARMVNDLYSWESIVAEIEKCELVCSNCHRLRTASRQ